MLTLMVAFRNISRQRKRSFLLSGAIAFGMLIITIINALTGGVVENIRDNFAHALGGHVFITGREYNQRDQVVNKIRPDARLDRLLADNADRIAAYTKRSQALPSLIFGSKQTMQLVYGVDFQEEDKLLNSLVLIDGSLQDVFAVENAAILPQPVAERLDHHALDCLAKAA